jgi:polyphosphate kinase
MEQDKIRRYGFISTGNFNESTAKVYTGCDIIYQSSANSENIMRIFEFFWYQLQVHRYKHLIVSPHYTRTICIIDREITHALAGKETHIKLKMNSLSDFGMIDKLYEASRAGVKNSTWGARYLFLTRNSGMSENIEAISIVDNYLEHSRVYIFGMQVKPSIHFICWFYD